MSFMMLFAQSPDLVPRIGMTKPRAGFTPPSQAECPEREKSVAALTGVCGVPSATDFRCQGARVSTRYRSCMPIKEGSRNRRQRLVEVGLQKRASLVLEPTIERLLALGE
jgi:hypothetical protein